MQIIPEKKTLKQKKMVRNLASNYTNACKSFYASNSICMAQRSELKPTHFDRKLKALEP